MRLPSRPLDPSGPASRAFETDLDDRSEQIRAAGFWRELRRIDSPQGAQIGLAGTPFLNFSSNDYLGLANHPAVLDAASAALRQFGAGSGSARLICGSLAPHHQLEESLAHFKQTEAALVFSSGYLAALGTITALLEKQDVLILDKRVHASIVDAARLSGASLRICAHNDLNDLEDLLKWAAHSRSSGSLRRTLIVTESIFSMDGDTAPLREIVELKRRYGAWLMVDEAHATGLYGPGAAGLCQELGVSSEVEVHMGTLGKALGAAGGFICGSKRLIEFLLNRARPFIFSTAPPPAVSASAHAALHVVLSPEGAALRSRLQDHMETAGHLLGLSITSAIVPIMVGAENAALTAAQQLRDKAIFIPAIRFPTVPRGQARLRLTLSAAHTASDLERLGASLREMGLAPR